MRRISDHVQMKYPEYVRGLADPEVHRRVTSCVARARAYGITWESCLAAFTVLAVVYGPGFDRHPRIASVLADEALEPNLRVKLLPSRTTQRDWSEASAQHRDWHGR